jgi:hypothetical protein
MDILPSPREIELREPPSTQYRYVPLCYICHKPIYPILWTTTSDMPEVTGLPLSSEEREARLTAYLLAHPYLPLTNDEKKALGDAEYVQLTDEQKKDIAHAYVVWDKDLSTEEGVTVFVGEQGSLTVNQRKPLVRVLLLWDVYQPYTRGQIETLVHASLEGGCVATPDAFAHYRCMVEVNEAAHEEQHARWTFLLRDAELYVEDVYSAPICDAFAGDWRHHCALCAAELTTRRRGGYYTRKGDSQYTYIHGDCFTHLTQALTRCTPPSGPLFDAQYASFCEKERVRELAATQRRKDVMHDDWDVANERKAAMKRAEERERERREERRAHTIAEQEKKNERRLEAMRYELALAKERKARRVEKRTPDQPISSMDMSEVDEIGHDGGASLVVEKMEPVVRSVFDKAVVEQYAEITYRQTLNTIERALMRNKMKEADTTDIPLITALETQSAIYIKAGREYEQKQNEMMVNINAKLMEEPNAQEAGTIFTIATASAGRALATTNKRSRVKDWSQLLTEDQWTSFNDQYIRDMTTDIEKAQGRLNKIRSAV